MRESVSRVAASALGRFLTCLFVSSPSCIAPVTSRAPQVTAFFYLAVERMTFCISAPIRPLRLEAASVPEQRAKQTRTQPNRFFFKLFRAPI
jgi:hypothetical protein